MGIEIQSSMSIDRYNEIVDLNADFNPVKIVPFIPSPKDEDYKRGYITRYFIQKANNTNDVIYEVKKNSISKLTNNTFYSVVSLDWRIIGSKDDIKKSNSESIRIASNIIPKIQLYLPNLLQFHQK